MELIMCNELLNKSFTKDDFIYMHDHYGWPIFNQEWLVSIPLSKRKDCIFADKYHPYHWINVKKNKTIMLHISRELRRLGITEHRSF